jgi:threonine dehydratase
MFTLTDILLARQRLGSLVYHTPLQFDYVLGRRCGCELYLKLENHQRTGSFKVRGALNRIATLTAAERGKGVVTASMGNHGLGVAYAARASGGMPVTVFLPQSAPKAKAEKLVGLGADVQLAGDSYESAHHAADAFRAVHGVPYVHAYDDPMVIAGQGTVGLEIMEDLPDVDTIVVPIGGGGLSAGIALAAKTLNPSVRVVGVQPDASPAAYLSFRDGYAYEEYDAAPTIADGLAGGYGRIPFEIARHLIDDVLVVSEAHIRQAVRALLESSQEVVEGSGAVAIAPLLSGQLRLPGRKVVAVLSGHNIDASLLTAILSENCECTALD